MISASAVSPEPEQASFRSNHAPSTPRPLSAWYLSPPSNYFIPTPSKTGLGRMARRRDCNVEMNIPQRFPVDHPFLYLRVIRHPERAKVPPWPLRTSWVQRTPHELNATDIPSSAERSCLLPCSDLPGECDRIRWEDGRSSDFDFRSCSGPRNNRAGRGGG